MTYEQAGIMRLADYTQKAGTMFRVNMKRLRSIRAQQDPLLERQKRVDSLTDTYSSIQRGDFFLNSWICKTSLDSWKAVDLKATYDCQGRISLPVRPLP